MRLQDLYNPHLQNARLLESALTKKRGGGGYILQAKSLSCSPSCPWRHSHFCLPRVPFRRSLGGGERGHILPAKNSFPSSPLAFLYSLSLRPAWHLSPTVLS